MQSLKDKLQNYLTKKWPEAQSVVIENLADLPGGWSKRTWSFDAIVDRDNVKTVYPLILRQDTPKAAAIMLTDRENEHIIITRVREHTTVPVPRSYFVEMDATVFGEPAMIIERLIGNSQPVTLFQKPELQEEARNTAKHYCEQLAALHLSRQEALNSDNRFNDPRNLGINVSSWDSYIDSSIEHFISEYPKFAYDPFPIYYDAILHLRRNKPRPLPLVLLHGEVNPNNAIYKDGKVLGLIDWELAHIGDPREDVAWFQQVDFLAGTKFFESVDFPGGFLGYYNHLTGFNISIPELLYFNLFASAANMAQLMAPSRRRLEGQHREIFHYYAMEQIIPAFFVGMGKLLGYSLPTPA